MTEQLEGKAPMDDFEADIDGDYGISSKTMTGELSHGTKGKPALDISEVRDEPENSDEKPRVEYVEDIRKPYWDTKNVVGAHRNPSAAGYASEKLPSRPGFWQRRRNHYRRYWILYTVGIVILFAILLPIL